MTKIERGETLRVGGIELVIVDSIHLGLHESGNGFWARGSREPVAVVVTELESGRTRALGIDGEELALDEIP